MAQTKNNIPQIRFKGFYDEWEKKFLKDIFIERHQVSTITKEYPQLSFTIADGVIKPEDRKSNKRDFLIIDKENKKYLITEYDDIIYNPANVIFGAIHRNALCKGVVSPIYKIFFTEYDSSFMDCIVRNQNFINKMTQYLEGTVTKLKTLKPQSFLSMSAFVSPKKEEQKIIGHLFYTLDTLIATRQKKLESLKNLKKACLVKMFPQNGSKVPEIRFKGFSGEWEEKKLGEISKSYSGGTPSVDIKEYYGGNIPFIRSGEINEEHTELFVTERGIKNSSAKEIQKGTILYALYGATSGEVAISKIDGVINQAILAILPKESYDSEFVANSLKAKKKYIVDTYIQGGQGNLSGKIVNGIKIFFPVLKEQKVISNYFSNLDNLILTKGKEIEKLQNLKKACLDKMFV